MKIEGASRLEFDMNLLENNRGGHPPYENIVPLQAEEGDLAIFLRKEAIEIEFDREKFLIVPQSAILLLIREDDLQA